LLANIRVNYGFAHKQLCWTKQATAPSGYHEGMTLLEVAGERLLVLDATGPALGSYRDATDVIGEALGQDATMVVLPVERLQPAFFELKTRVAGEFIQKLINYRLKVAVVGDITAQVEASDALRDFVRESNRGNSVCFLPDLDALQARLK
jgi:hypothetical protein